MKSNFVHESLEDILKPKTKKEIIHNMDSVKLWKIISLWDENPEYFKDNNIKVPLIVQVWEKIIELETVEHKAWVSDIDWQFDETIKNMGGRMYEDDIIGVTFKLSPQMPDNLKTIIIDEYDSDRNLLWIHVSGTSNIKKIKTIKEVEDYIEEKLNLNIVKESLFKPKSEEEIIQNLEKKYIIEDEDVATEYLKSGIDRNSLALTKYALSKGARTLDQMLSGNLWRGFNNGGNPIMQEIIIEMLKEKRLQKIIRDNQDTRISIIRKSLYMGMLRVIIWFMKEFKDIVSNQDVGIALSSVEESNWSGNPAVEEWLEHWLEQRYKGLDESMGDVLKPKSRKEIINALETVTYDEYYSAVENGLENIINSYNLDPYIDFFDFDETIKKEFKRQSPPYEVAKKFVEEYYKKKWKAERGMQLTNAGGMEIKIVNGGDRVEYRYTGQTIPRGAEIHLHYRNRDGDRNEYFEDEMEEKWYLDQFMAIRK